MPEKISVLLNVQVVGGPKISEAKTLDVQAYDKIDVTIADGAADEDVEIQPGGAGQVQFLLIRSDQYGDKLTYKVNSAGASPVILDAQHVLIGAGAVGLLGAAPTKLLFSNALGKVATVHILVGRKATTA
jgi:hypothetical protein